MKNIEITWGVLFVGLKNGWLTTNEVVRIANENSDKLECDSDTLVELNVNEDSEDVFLELVKERGESEKEQATRYWQLKTLLTIEQSQEPIEEKLKEIGAQWARFDYPEDWRKFIHYMPNEDSNTPEHVYQIFLDYLKNEQD